MQIDDIRIEDPCCESWYGMAGDETWRHCERCDKDVVNLSELSRREATELVLDANSLCVRFRRDSTGNVIFQHVQLGRQRRGARELVVAAACIAPFLFWAVAVSPLNDEMSWGGGDERIIEEMQVTVQGGISWMPPREEGGYDYYDVGAEPQAVVFIDENGTPRLDKHALPAGQSVSDGIPRLVVP